jgi:5-methylcytosine-specific restriction endonuclease McrA
VFLEVYPQVLGVSTLKHCTKCGQYKPKSAEFFYPAPAYRDGLRSRCRSCESEHRRKRNVTDKRQKVMPKARPGFKYCPRCERELPTATEYFYPDASRQSGISSSCRECAQQYGKEYRAANPEKHAEAKRTWNAANPEKVKAHRSLSQKRNRTAANERVRQFYRRNPAKRLENVHARRARILGNGGRYTPADIEAIRLAQTDKRGRVRCWYCGTPMQKWHIDHKTPLARGGSNGPENLCLACVDCNLKKHAKTPDEFAGRLI